MSQTSELQFTAPAHSGATTSRSRSNSRNWSKWNLKRWYNNSLIQLNVLGRKTQLVATALCSQDRFLTIASTATVVYSIGIVEGMLLSKRPYYFPFLLRYAREQLLPSIIWGTKSASDILLAMKKNPSAHLFFDAMPHSNDMLNAKIRLRIQYLQTLRSIIFGFVGISQLLSLASIVSETNEAYSISVMNGKERFLTNKRLYSCSGSSFDDENIDNYKKVKENGKAIRFVGSYADSAMYNYMTGDRNIIPILELLSESGNISNDLGVYINMSNSLDGKDRIRNKDGQRLYTAQKKFRERITENGLIPSFWSIVNEKYSDKHEWINFDKCINDDILFNSKKNEKIQYLIIEGDSSVSEQSSIMIKNDNYSDLTLNQFTQGLSSVENIARDKFDKNVEIVTIFLSNENSTLQSGGLFEHTLKDRIKKFSDVDLLIDTKKPLIKETVKWLKSNNHKDEVHTGGDGDHDGDDDGKRIILFDTCNREYFEQISSTLGKHGWKVQDFMEYVAKRGNNDEHVDKVNIDYNIPLLIYQNNSFETINTLESHLRTQRLKNLQSCCVLIDDFQAIQNIQQLEKKYKCDNQINFVCSGVVYDKLFAQVRDNIVNSDPADIPQIQKWIDSQLHM